jgi:signal transduction histidine kinase
VELAAHFDWATGHHLEVEVHPLRGTTVGLAPPPAVPAGAAATAVTTVGEPAPSPFSPVPDSTAPVSSTLAAADAVADAAAPAAQAPAPQASAALTAGAAFDSDPPATVGVTVGGLPTPATVGPGPEETSVDSGVVAMMALAAAGASALAVDGDGLVTSATPDAERLLGVPIARLRGAELAALLILPDQAGPALAAARRNGARQTVAATLAADGRGVALEWVPGGRPGAGLAVLARDLPASEDAERLRLQTRLVTFIAHDVRNAIAAVYCGLRTLSDLVDPGTPARVTVDKALADVQRASRIVEDVQAVSRPGKLNCVELDLSSLLGESLNRFRARAAAGGVELLARLEAPARVQADLSQLERAFDNLVENAIQAMPQGGRLTLSTRFEERSGRGVVVELADNGLGIPADVRPNVFEPYATRKKDGTGLGLAITRRAVLDHGGQIDFHTADGRGTTFFVWLPCV